MPIARSRKTKLPEPKTTIRRKDLARAEKLYMHAKGAQAEWAQTAFDNLQLSQNVAFTTDEVAIMDGQGLAALATPLLLQVSDQFVSLIAAEEPSFVALPREDSDVKVAKLKSDHFKYIWQGAGTQYINGQVRLIQAVFDDFVMGRGVFFAYVDAEGSEGQGEVAITTLDPLEVFPDPYSREPDWSDASYIIVSRLITKEQAYKSIGKKHTDRLFRRNNPNNRPEPEKGNDHPSGRAMPTEGQIFLGDTHSLEPETYRLIELYEREELQLYKVREDRGRAVTYDRVFDEDTLEEYRSQTAFAIGETNTGNFTRFALSQEDVEEFEGVFVSTGAKGNVAQLPVPDNTPEGFSIVLIQRTTKGALIDAGIIEVIPFKERRMNVEQYFGRQYVDTFVLDTTEYPIIPMMSQHRRTPYPTAIATQLRNNIDEFNKMTQIEIAWAHSIAGPKLQGPEGAITDEGMDELVKPGPGYVSWRQGLDENEKPTPIVLQPLPNHFFLEKDRLLLRIYDASGLYPESFGAPTSGERTFRSDLIQEDRSKKRIKIKGDFLGLALNKLAKVVNELSRNVYTQPRLLRIFNPSSPQSEPFRQVAVNQPLYNERGDIISIQDDITASRADMVFVTGSTLPVNRMAERESYERIYQTLASTNPGAAAAFLPHYLKKHDIPEIDEILQTADIVNQLQQALQQSQQEIKRLSGDMQTADRELRQADRRISKSKFDAQLSEIKASVAKEGELTSQRMQDALKNVQQQDAQAPFLQRLEEAMQLFSSQQTTGEA